MFMQLKFFVLLSIFFSSTYFFHGCTDKKKVNIVDKFNKHDTIEELNVDFHVLPCGYIKENNSLQCISFIVNLCNKNYEIFFSSNDIQNIEIFIDENDYLSNNLQCFTEIREKQCLIFNQNSEIEDPEFKKKFSVFDQVDDSYDNEDIMKIYKPRKNKSEFSKVTDHQKRKYVNEGNK